MFKGKKHPSTAKHDFSEIPKADIQRSTFNRSHTHKTTMDAGLLIPIYADEALPGDTFKMDTSVFARMATAIAPIMDNARMSIHYFAVPKRLLWVNFEKFMGAQTNPGDSVDYLVPQVNYGTPVAEDSIHDYLGIPLGYEGTANAWWHRAYNLIWNEWYRDQNLQDSKTILTDDGPDGASVYAVQRRGKRHDYFTSCLPFPQKGPAVDIPLGDSAPVKIITGTGIETDGNNWKWDEDSLGGNITGQSRLSSSPGAEMQAWDSGSGSNKLLHYRAGLKINESELEVDLSGATAATINSLRMAFQLQKMYERDARGGTRYTEIIRSHFNVTSPDARLQRPEFLGGGTVDVTVNPVANTVGASGDSEQGSLAGVGTIGGSGMGFTRSFTEDMVILGIASITCDLTYQQGLNRMYSRQTRFDHYWPALAHLGEQEVLNKEIYTDNTAADEEIFGYQERFAEYRYFPSRISGKMRSTAATPLDIWHYSQEFATRPTLGEDFIKENPPIDRVIAVPSEPHFIVDMYFKLICDRPMPTYSVPGLIDHF